MTDRSGARGAVSGDPAGRYRWAICALLFAATAINYVDRQMIGVLKPTLQKDLGWSETAYADIVFWFQAAYAIGYLSFGRIIDRLGARIGYAVTFTIWTLSHMAHGLVGNVTQFALARFSLGLGESGSFPASLKAVSEWFPQKERALAVGLFNAGANVGAILTPLIVPAITLAWGWRMAFFITGGVSLIWLAAWLALYRRPERHKRVTPAELAYIRQDAPAVGRVTLEIAIGADDDLPDLRRQHVQYPFDQRTALIVDQPFVRAAHAATLPAGQDDGRHVLHAGGVSGGHTGGKDPSGRRGGHRPTP